MPEEVKYKVHYLMVEKDSGGFTTGKSAGGIFTREEMNEGKHEKLIEGIEMVDGCEWARNTSRIKPKRKIKRIIRR